MYSCVLGSKHLRFEVFMAIAIDKLDRFYGEEEEEGRRGAQVSGKERVSELKRPDVRQCSYK
jgi:hypothetical protein